MTKWGNFRWGLAYWGDAYLPDMIYDRTQTDVDNKTEKGYYNISDLNRVETGTEFVAKLLTQYGYPVTASIKNDWGISDFPVQSEMDRYLDNARRCVDNFCKKPTTPSLTTTINGLYYHEANTIEQVLEEAPELINNMINTYRYSGQFCCADMNGLRGYTMP